MAHGCVIVGAGQAGFETAAALRAEKYQGPITLIGDEPHLPYQRPPLSKGFILDKQGLDEIELRPSQFFRDHRIDLVTGDRVTALDRAEHRVRLASGAMQSYDTLVLACGARNRLLPVPGAERDGVLYLRTLDESRTVKQRLQDANAIVVVGGGFIGLEIAASARSLGKAVTVLEAQPRLMPRVVAPLVSAFYDTLHKARGVTIVCEACVTEIAGSTDRGGRAASVTLANGSSHPADLVIVGIGVVPNSELAREAGLETANGVVVDEYLQTSDPAIYAVGDCAAHPNQFAGDSGSTGGGNRVRLESVQNATDQARTVAVSIAGKRTTYTAVPWFWTDQFDIRLQMAGLSQGYDEAVTRGNPETQKFSVFYFKQSRLIAVDSVNRPADHVLARRLLASRTAVTPQQAADESVNLKTLG
jgi:3-phenylpropionate/trans-cinnamate dioxygenase ferredoxin reductase component